MFRFKSLCFALCIGAIAPSAAVSQQFVECSECLVCSLSNPDLTRFRDAWIFLNPGQELEGYVLGHLESWGCIEEMCDELIPCRGPFNFGEADIALLAAARDISRREAAAYLTRYPGTVIDIPERDAVQIRGCNGSLIAHLPRKRVVSELD
jgi:hypothetical protein